MKKITLLSFMLVLFVFQACTKKNDDPNPTTSGSSITAEAVSFTIDENPEIGKVLGKVSAKASDGSAITYAIQNESIAGGLKIDPNTGEVSIANDVPFDFEKSSQFTADFIAKTGTAEKTGKITVEINDKEEPLIIEVNMQASQYFGIYGKGPQPDTYVIDWGDGKPVETIATYNPVHQYLATGTFKIKISGNLYGIKFSNGLANPYITKVISWGDNEWKTFDEMFKNCTKLKEITAKDTPRLNKVTDMSYTFAGATSFNGDLSQWDVSNITNMSSMFQSAKAFNGDLSQWKTSKLERANSMFYYAEKFNSNINSWDMSNVIGLSNMFAYAKSFNQDLDQWDMSSVEYMYNMFDNARAFNGKVGTWNLKANPAELTEIFKDAVSFNQPLKDWNVSKTITVRGMFNGATAFNQDLSDWDLSKITIANNCKDFVKNTKVTCNKIPTNIAEFGNSGCTELP